MFFQAVSRKVSFMGTFSLLPGRCVACLTVFLVLPVSLYAQVQEETHVLDGAGGIVGSASFDARFSACQMGPIGDSSSGNFLNRAGFFTSFLLHPLQDADADGIKDEDDPDDDNDDLSDLTEIGGHGFDPQTQTDPLLADSDGDGMSDGEESVASAEESAQVSGVGCQVSAESVISGHFCGVGF